MEESMAKMAGNDTTIKHDHASNISHKRGQAHRAKRKSSKRDRQAQKVLLLEETWQ
jgi:hypothetical protein